jgi:hypothetical protein
MASTLWNDAWKRSAPGSRRAGAGGWSPPRQAAFVRRRGRDFRSGVLMRTLLRDPAAGLMHRFVYFGFVGLFMVTVVLEIDHQMPNALRFLHGGTYEAFKAGANAVGSLFLVGVLWAIEVCKRDRARRAGNEYLFQMLAMQNVAVACPFCYVMLDDGVKGEGKGTRYECRTLPRSCGRRSNAPVPLPHRRYPLHREDGRRSSVAVPFADGRFDVDHHLLCVTADVDAVQIAVQETDELLRGYGVVLDLQALAGKVALRDEAWGRVVTGAAS